MAKKQSRQKRRPTPFSMGDWLSREDTKRNFRQWQANERLAAGVDNPALLTEQNLTPRKALVRTNRSTEPPTPSVDDPNEDVYGLGIDEETQEHYSRETDHVVEVITAEFESRFDLALEKLEQLPDLKKSTNALSSEIERTQASIEELKERVEETLHGLDNQLRFCRREIRMLREGGPKTVGDFMALENRP